MVLMLVWMTIMNMLATVYERRKTKTHGMSREVTRPCSSCKYHAHPALVRIATNSLPRMSKKSATKLKAATRARLFQMSLNDALHAVQNGSPHMATYMTRRCE
jgi:hypothetical protein